MARRAVIVGAGITGALTALELSRRGWAVTVLEAKHLGAGSSSRTAAGIRQQFSTPETVLGMRHSVRFYEGFRDRTGSETAPLQQVGYLFLLDGMEAFEAARSRVAMQRAHGLREAELLDQGDLRRRFPWVSPEAVLGATFCPTDGFLRPEVIYTEAMAAAARLGAVLHTECPVTGAEGRLDAVLTPRGRFAADVFLDCTNAWSPRVAQVLGGTALDIAPLKRYLWFCKRAGGLSEAAFAAMPLVVAPSGAYCRPENRDSLLLGWAHDARPEPVFSYEDQDRVEPAFFHRGDTDSMAFSAWAAIAEVIPAVGEFAGLTATTCGYYATTPDHNPFLDLDPAVPNLVRLCGYSGHGAMFGPFSALVGAALADGGGRLDAVETEVGRVPLAPFSIGRSYRHAESLVL